MNKISEPKKAIVKALSLLKGLYNNVDEDQFRFESIQMIPNDCIEIGISIMSNSFVTQYLLGVDAERVTKYIVLDKNLDFISLKNISADAESII